MNSKGSSTNTQSGELRFNGPYRLLTTGGQPRYSTATSTVQIIAPTVVGEVIIYGQPPVRTEQHADRDRENRE